MKGVESEERAGIKPSRDSEGLFQQPNEISVGDIYTEDSWDKGGRGFNVLAKTSDGKTAVGRYRYGKGMYIVTSFYHMTFFQVARSQRLMENLMYFAARHIQK